MPLPRATRENIAYRGTINVVLAGVSILTDHYASRGEVPIRVSIYFHGLSESRSTQVMRNSHMNICMI